MKPLVMTILCGLLLLSGCTTAPVPSKPSQPAAPGVAERLLAAIQPLTPAEAAVRRDQWGIPGVAAFCAATETLEPEQTVLACQWGQGYNAMFDGRMLVWREGGAWKSQPYPAEAVRGVGYFQRLYRTGDDLIVVMNVARGMTMGTEQVQVLHLNAGWKVAWLPSEADWTKGHATVSFEEPGYDRFIVNTDSYGLAPQEKVPFAESNAGDHRPFREEWARENQGYRLLSRTELPSEYGAVVHFVQALVAGDEEEAARWVTSPEVLKQAKALGIVEAAGSGFFTRREGSTAEGWGKNGPMYRLIANNGTEQPQWLVSVAPVGDNRAVSAVTGR